MLKTAIIGCGKIADQHAELIRRVEGARLVGVCDREILMADQLAERYQAPGSFDDVDRLLERIHPDVVHITTPPQSHFELAIKCLKAGCHVYVEKPFSMDSAQARSMIALAEQKGLRLTAGHNGQFNPEMIRMRELVRNGAIGKHALHIESVFSYSLDDTSYMKAVLADNNHWLRRLPGKLLQNIISHGIAKIVEFLDPTEIKVAAYGFTSPALAKTGADLVDELRVMMSDHHNRTAYFTFTTQIRPPVQELRVFGESGSIVVDNLRRTVLHLNRSNSEFKSYLNFFIPPAKIAAAYGHSVWTNISSFLKSDFHMDAGLKRLIEGFYRSIQFGQELPIPYREILLTASIMDEIFRQMDVRLENSPAGETAACSAIAFRS